MMLGQSRTSADRRPWLILSQREVRTLVNAALSSCPDAQRDPELARVLHVIALQERWIAGAADGIRPRVERALDRA